MPTSTPNFEALIAEAEKAGFSGWDFSYLEGRYKESAPSWDYRQMVLERMADSSSLLDMGTGGGEFLASLGALPPHTCATEGFPPNLSIARACLAPLGVRVESACGDENLPFPDGSFDLVINRHESYSPAELKRILKPGGCFLTQQVGGRDNFLLNERLQDEPCLEYAGWNLQTARKQLEDAGFTVRLAKEEMLPTRFSDIGAVVYYLKAIPWQIPDFSPEKERLRLLQLHREIIQNGALITHSHRFILEASRAME